MAYYTKMANIERKQLETCTQHAWLSVCITISLTSVYGFFLLTRTSINSALIPLKTKLLTSDSESILLWTSNKAFSWQQG